jgi:hypothetical protein
MIDGEYYLAGDPVLVKQRRKAKLATSAKCDGI